MWKSGPICTPALFCARTSGIRKTVVRKQRHRADEVRGGKVALLFCTQGTSAQGGCYTSALDRSASRPTFHEIRGANLWHAGTLFPRRSMRLPGRVLSEQYCSLSYLRPRFPSPCFCSQLQPPLSYLNMKEAAHRASYSASCEWFVGVIGFSACPHCRHSNVLCSEPESNPPVTNVFLSRFGHCYYYDG